MNCVTIRVHWTISLSGYGYFSILLILLILFRAFVEFDRQVIHHGSESLIHLPCIRVSVGARKMAEQILKDIRAAIRKYDPDLTQSLAEEALKKGLRPQKIVEEMSEELKAIGTEFSEGVIFLVELVGAATAAEGVMKVLRESIEKSKEKIHYQGKIVLGTVAGDIHSIGKNIVASVLIANGFEVIDIGEDQPVSAFVNKVKEEKPDIVGASALLTTTMTEQSKLVEALNKEGLRDKVKVIIGGAPITEEWCREIGADGYAHDAFEAVRLVKRLLNKD